MFDPVLALDIIRVILLGAVLGVAAYQDIRCGEVKNKVWLYVPFGLGLYLIELFAFSPEIIFYALPIMGLLGGLCFGLFFLFEYLSGIFRGVGLVFGGADCKALITICLCCPLVPFGSLTNLILPMVTFAVAAFMMIAYCVIKKTKVVRFVPFLFAAFIFTLI